MFFQFPGPLSEMNEAQFCHYLECLNVPLIWWIKDGGSGNGLVMSISWKAFDKCLYLKTTHTSQYFLR